jgi:hypothetical protein
MSQNDLNIANQTASATRSDINSALQALGSNNSGSSAPTTTYANMHWYDTSSNMLKQRSEADDAWISIGYFDQSTNAFKVLDDTIVVNTSGTQTGLIGDQAQSTWVAGTGTTESLISPAKLKAFGDALIDVNGLTSSNYLEVGGLIVQWKTGSFLAQENNIQTITLPTTFPNALLNCQIAMELNAGANMDGSLYIRSTSTSQVNFQFSHTTAGNYGYGTVHILAIGH